MAQYQAAHQKLESKRNEFDKKLIKLNEKYEVIKGIFYWDFLKITPISGDKLNRWVQPKRGYELSLSAQALDSIYVLNYVNKLDKAKDTLGIQNLFQQLDMYNDGFDGGKKDGTVNFYTEKLWGPEITKKLLDQLKKEMEKEKEREKKEMEKVVGTRGRTFEGTVTKKFDKRVVIEFERTVRVPKYERFMKKKTKIKRKNKILLIVFIEHF